MTKKQERHVRVLLVLLFILSYFFIHIRRCDKWRDEIIRQNGTCIARTMERLLLVIEVRLAPLMTLER